MPSGETRDLFVAIGHGAHTTVSCDDGRTWVANAFRVDVPLEGTDTDHHPFGVRSGAFDDGWFYALYGWGSPAYLERSRDGVTWEASYGTAEDRDRDGYWAWGMTAGGGTVVLGENLDFDRSTSGGDTWEHYVLPLDLFAKPTFGYGDGVFVAHSSDAGAIMTSTDARTWTNASAPGGCFGSRPMILYADGSFLLTSRSSFCISSDGGANWTQHAFVVDDETIRGAAWNGEQFLAVGSDGTLASSTDGRSWSSVGRFPGGGTAEPLPLQGNPTTGTFVAARRGVFYRSDDDGATFTALDDGAYDGSGGAIDRIVFGRGEPSAACP